VQSAFTPAPSEYAPDCPVLSSPRPPDHSDFAAAAALTTAQIQLGGGLVLKLQDLVVDNFDLWSEVGVDPQATHHVATQS
jgi:hypothetical protein